MYVYIFWHVVEFLAIFLSSSFTFILSTCKQCDIHGRRLLAPVATTSISLSATDLSVPSRVWVNEARQTAKDIWVHSEVKINTYM